MTESRECLFSDGLFDPKDEQCQRCYPSHRKLCELFKHNFENNNLIIELLKKEEKHATDQDVATQSHNI